PRDQPRIPVLNRAGDSDDLVSGLHVLEVPLAYGGMPGLLAIPGLLRLPSLRRATRLFLNALPVRMLTLKFGPRTPSFRHLAGPLKPLRRTDENLRGVTVAIRVLDFKAVTQAVTQAEGKTDRTINRAPTSLPRSFPRSGLGSCECGRQ